jgi:uncharacterized protein (DUF433 family)
MDYQKRIISDPLVRDGKPCVRGTSIAVTDVIEYLARGMSITETLKDFPELIDEDIKACLHFAAKPWPLDGSTD